MAAMEGISHLFNIDCDPSPSVHSWSPIYDESSVVVVKTEAENETSKEKPSRPKPRGICWNCSEDGHSIAQCEKPRNRDMIMKNKRAHYESNVRLNEFKRYHVEIKGDRFPRCKPGVISDKLRKALNLNDNQLPPYIYTMRKLDYPPGWLEEAVVTNSGLDMYDINGDRVPDPDDEEGEVDSEHIKYDLNKIVEYPGFNVRPDFEYIEEGNFFRAPPMNPSQSKEAMMARLQPFAAVYRGGRREVSSDSPSGAEVEDMDAEEIEPGSKNLDDSSIPPPLPQEELPPPPPENIPQPPDQTENKSEDKGRIPEDNTSLSNISVNSLDMTPVDSPLSGLNSEMGKTKSILLGTPTIKIHSPYMSLPAPEKFQKDVSDVINFENLPNSTGQYEKMNGVISKVRQKLVRLNQKGIAPSDKRL